MGTPFDLARFPLPLYLVVSSKDNRQPEMFSLFNEAIALPVRRWQDFSFTPIFTSVHQANKFAESENVPDAVILTMKDVDELNEILHQAKGHGRTHMAFDPSPEPGRLAAHSIEEILDAIRKQRGR